MEQTFFTAMDRGENPLRILMVEDSAIDAELILDDLRRGNLCFEAKRVEDEQALRNVFEVFSPDLILADYRLPNFDGCSAMRIAREYKPGIPLIFVSGAIGEERAVELLKAGATDYVLKHRLERLPLAVHRAMEEMAEREARQKAEKELRTLNQQLELRVVERTRELTEKTRLLLEELRMARQLQLAILPQRFPTVPADASADQSAVRFLSFYQPSAAVSGDFFEVLQLSDTTLGLLVCDVMGHDVRAALVTGMLRALVQELGSVAADPGAMLAHLNRSLAGILRQADTTMFATACYLVADLANRQLLYANAGHPQPLHVKRQRGEVNILNSNRHGGPALGLLRDSRYGTCTSSLESGDFLMLFTDGLFEIEHPATHEPFRIERVLEVAKNRVRQPASELFYGLLEEARHFASDNGFEDDVCLLGMEVRG